MHKKILASELAAGNVIVKAGATVHSPITVTEVKTNLLNQAIVYGFNGHNPEPRLMFRGLKPTLPVLIKN